LLTALERLTTIFAVKGGRVEQYVQTFNMTTLCSNDRNVSFPKLSDHSIYVPLFTCHPVCPCSPVCSYVKYI